MSDPIGGTAWTPGSYAAEPDEASPEEVNAPAESATPSVESNAVEAPEPAPVRTAIDTPAPPAVTMPPTVHVPAPQPMLAPAAVQPIPVAVQPAPQPLPPPLRPPPPTVGPQPVQPKAVEAKAGPQPLPPPLRPPPPPTSGPLPERAYASAPPPPPFTPLPVAPAAGVSGGGSRVDVINRDGWRKEFPLRRTLAYVGSQPGSDIYLPQPDVAPRHVQFVPSPINRAGYRAINFSNAPLALRLSSGELRAVPPRGAAEIADGDAVELAGYSLVFHSGEMQSAAIQARIDLAGTRIEVARPLDGALYIRNAGDKAGVQFEVSPQGFDEHFLQIEPGPVLFPGVEKRVGFRIAHPRQGNPSAGDHTIKFVVTAPDVYPGESAIVSALITVAPYFAHAVRFISVIPEMSRYTLR